MKLNRQLQKIVAIIMIVKFNGGFIEWPIRELQN